jgi:uncharacterized membrane protein
VSTETLSSLDYLTFNTRSNRVAIISSVITKIFLTLCNTETVTFQPVSIKTLMIYIYIYCAYVLVPVICYSLFIYLCSLFIICCSFIFVHCSTIYFIIVYFHFSSILCFICWLKEKRTILILNLCSGISIPLPANHHQYESINIIQQTPPTLS